MKNTFLGKFFGKNIRFLEKNNFIAKKARQI
jgi:hypothetical protein